MHRAQALATKLLHRHEPLLGDQRLHDRVAALAVAHHVMVLLDALQQPLLLQRRDDLAPRIEAVHPGVGACLVGHQAAIVDHNHARQAMVLRDLEVGRVVRGRHLHRARAEPAIHQFIGHHGDLTVHQRQHHGLPDQVRVTLVIGMDRHGRVAQHRLRARGRDDHSRATTWFRVADMPEVAGMLRVLDLEVGEAGLAARAPVDHPGAAVDQALLVERHEGLAHRAGEALVEREALARPVGRAAEALELADDHVMVIVRHLPRLLKERLAPEILTGFPLLRQHLLHNVLRGDAGVVGARQPERRVALHPAPAGQQVLDCVIQRVAHVQRTRDIRRRDDDAERLALAIYLRARHVVVEPVLIPLALHGFVIVGRRHLLGHWSCSSLSERSGLSSG